jgi:hypothetical protein
MALHRYYTAKVKNCGFAPPLHRHQVKERETNRIRMNS